MYLQILCIYLQFYLEVVSLYGFICQNKLACMLNPITLTDEGIGLGNECHWPSIKGPNGPDTLEPNLYSAFLETTIVPKLGSQGSIGTFRLFHVPSKHSFFSSYNGDLLSEKDHGCIFSDSESEFCSISKLESY